ncbi:hypothetical protein AURDEDRAFT_131247 [Auricularia subglabra TFB-10046 SS5]|uniref:Uncharacterized protein n=1 Tax=Auricularia subglabra (strain TFB-10046 / SS5) TaxID=717982 RepID=J0D614_AURST|nr:hypothetical protein AURDEDRAFT_131247 [Auricularia subglabra TFB-10046 SS5]
MDVPRAEHEHKAVDLGAQPASLDALPVRGRAEDNRSNERRSSTANTQAGNTSDRRVDDRRGGGNAAADHGGGFARSPHDNRRPHDAGRAGGDSVPRRHNGEGHGLTQGRDTRNFGSRGSRQSHDRPLSSEDRHYRPKDDATASRTQRGSSSGARRTQDRDSPLSPPPIACPSTPSQDGVGPTTRFVTPPRTLQDNLWDGPGHKRKRGSSQSRSRSPKRRRWEDSLDSETHDWLDEVRLQATNLFMDNAAKATKIGMLEEKVAHLYRVIAETRWELAEKTGQAGRKNQFDFVEDEIDIMKNPPALPERIDDGLEDVYSEVDSDFEKRQARARRKRKQKDINAKDRAAMANAPPIPYPTAPTFDSPVDSWPVVDDDGGRLDNTHDAELARMASQRGQGARRPPPAPNSSGSRARGGEPQAAPHDPAHDRPDHGVRADGGQRGYKSMPQQQQKKPAKKRKPTKIVTQWDLIDLDLNLQLRLAKPENPSREQRKDSPWWGWVWEAVHYGARHTSDFADVGEYERGPRAYTGNGDPADLFLHLRRCGLALERMLSKTGNLEDSDLGAFLIRHRRITTQQQELRMELEREHAGKKVDLRVERAYLSAHTTVDPLPPNRPVVRTFTAMQRGHRYYFGQDGLLRYSDSAKSGLCAAELGPRVHPSSRSGFFGSNMAVQSTMDDGEFPRRIACPGSLMNGLTCGGKTDWGRVDRTKGQGKKTFIVAQRAQCPTHRIVARMEGNVLARLYYWATTPGQRRTLPKSKHPHGDPCTHCEGGASAECDHWLCAPCCRKVGPYCNVHGHAGDAANGKVVIKNISYILWRPKVDLPVVNVDGRQVIDVDAIPDPAPKMINIEVNCEHRWKVYRDEGKQWKNLRAIKVLVEAIHYQEEGYCKGRETRVKHDCYLRRRHWEAEECKFMLTDINEKVLEKLGLDDADFARMDDGQRRKIGIDENTLLRAQRLESRFDDHELHLVIRVHGSDFNPLKRANFKSYAESWDLTEEEMAVELNPTKRCKTSAALLG